MTRPSFDEDELLQLIGAVRDELINSEQMQRLEGILSQDAEARRYYLRCLAIHGLLEQAAAGVAVVPNASTLPMAPAPQRSASRRWTFRFGLVAAIAAALLIAVASWWALPVQRDKGGPPDRASERAWKVTPAGDARFTRISPTSLRLERGEVRIQSVQRDGEALNAAHDLAALTIETPAGKATINGTDFLVGTHETSHSRKEGEIGMNHFTRVLVLAGMATLVNAHGSVTGETNSLLAAQRDQAPARQTIEANTGFAVDLYRQLTKEQSAQNHFLSPYSISLALTMAAEGARGQTAEEMGQVLRFPKAARRMGDDAQLIPWHTALIHTGLARISRDLTGKAQQEKNLFELRIANALWGERTFPFRPQFVQALNDSYDIGVALPCDFLQSFEQERLRINGWVAEKTNQRIENLLPPGSVTSRTRLALTNAIYFKGDWQQKFNKRNTRPDGFTTLAGVRVKAPMMSGEFQRAKFAFIGSGDAAASLQAGKANNFRLVELPYKGGLAMVLIAPDNTRGLPDLENQLTTANLGKWLGQLRAEEKVEVKLPRIKFTTTYDLPETLKRLGMVRAFREPGPEGADFSGMSHAEPLYLTAAVHKAFVAVHEEGTEAAAATGIVVGMTGPAPRPTPQFLGDRPFLFLIRDPQSGAILFMGRVVDAAGIANNDSSDGQGRGLELARTAPTKHPLYQKLKQAAGVAVIRAHRNPNGLMELKADNTGRSMYECRTILSLQGAFQPGAVTWLTFENSAEDSEVGRDLLDFLSPNYTKLNVLAIYQRQGGQAIVQELFDLDDETRLIVSNLYSIPLDKLAAAVGNAK